MTNARPSGVRRQAAPAAGQRGVGLIDTMVGLTIGLLVTLVIMTVWGNFESQKQRTISGASAQVNGLLALTQVEQELRNAGAGLTDSAAFDCTTIYSWYTSGGSTVSPVPAFTGNLAPVVITDGGAGPDTLTIKRSGDLLGAIPAVLTQTMPSSSSELNVNFTTGFNIGDIVLAVDSGSGNCTVMLATQVQAAAQKLQHNPGDTTTWNPSPSYQASNGWPAYSTGAKIEKIGQVVAHTFSVAGNQLTLTDATNPAATATTVVSAGIVSLQAQYGIANTGSQDVSAWVNATAATGWNVLTPVKVRQIKAVRVAIVARSGKKEASDVTPACTDSAGTVVNANGPCVWAGSEPVLNLSADPDWKKYRYRIYQALVPLRNVIWAGV
jgi:type IV pilus assembly protein PilW